MQIIFDNENEISNSGGVDSRVLLYAQGGLANIQKENVLENLESEEVEFKSVGEFLLELKKEFRGEDEEVS